MRERGKENEKSNISELVIENRWEKQKKNKEEEKKGFLYEKD